LTASIQNINGNNPYTIQIFPNPLKEEKLNIRFHLEKDVPVNYIITNVTGQIVQEGNLNNIKPGDNNLNIHIKNENISGQLLNVTFIFDNRYYSSHKVVVP